MRFWIGQEGKTYEDPAPAAQTADTLHKTAEEKKGIFY